MDYFAKSVHIDVKLHEISSLKSALLQYRQHLNNGSAFSEQHFDIEFVVREADTTRRLQFSDIHDQPLRDMTYTAVSMGPDSETIERDIHIADDAEIYFSEVILFAIALQYPQLKQEVIDTAQAMVALSRFYNDTSDMWCDDMRLFGVEALFVLACHDLQQLPLLAQFFIPYWDDEHAGGYSDYLIYFVDKFGWSHEVINAFIWCDNDELRYLMFADPWLDSPHHQPLGEFLQQNSEEYQWFKQALRARLLAAPKMLAGEYQELEDANPVLDFYVSLLPFQGERYEDEDMAAHLQQHFISATLEDEACDLQQNIMAQSSQPLVCYGERTRLNLQREQAKEEYDYNLGIVHELITALPQGDALWQYVLNGANQGMLNSVAEVALAEFSRQHAPLFYTELRCVMARYNHSSNEQIAQHGLEFLTNLNSDLLCDDDDAYLFSEHLPMPAFASEEARLALFLRIVDVIYRILGKQEFSAYVRDTIIRYSELTPDVFYARYSQLAPGKLTQPEQAANLHEVTTDFSFASDLLCAKHLHKADALFCEHRELLDPQCWTYFDDVTEVGHYALMAYLLNNDWQHNIGDAYTQKLAEHLEGDAVWQSIAALLWEHFDIYGEGPFDKRGMKAEHQAQLVDYFSAEQPKLSQEQAIALFHHYALHSQAEYKMTFRYNHVSEYQRKYLFLSDLDDNFQRVLLLCYWLRELPLPCARPARRIWELMLALAPIRVARLVLQTYSAKNHVIEFNDDVLKETESYEKLEKAGVERGYLDALELTCCNLNDPRGMQTYLDKIELFADIDSQATSMFAQIDIRRARSLQKGLRFIYETDKTGFYQHLALQYPRFSYQNNAELQHDFHVTITRFLQDNLTFTMADRFLPTQEEIACFNAKVNKAHDLLLDYLAGTQPYSAIFDFLSQEIGQLQEMDVQAESYRLNGLDSFIWLLDTHMRDRLTRLLLNLNYRGFKLFEHNILPGYLAREVARERMTLADYLSADEDDYSEQAVSFFLNWLQGLGICCEHLALFCIKHKHLNSCQRLLTLLAHQNIEAISQYLSRNNRRMLVELLARDGANHALLNHFSDDPSRLVRNTLERVLTQ